jgi:hypothetical protein
MASEYDVRTVVYLKANDKKKIIVYKKLRKDGNGGS